MDRIKLGLWIAVIVLLAATLMSGRESYVVNVKNHELQKQVDSLESVAKSKALVADMYKAEADSLAALKNEVHIVYRDRIADVDTASMREYFVSNYKYGDSLQVAKDLLDRDRCLKVETIQREQIKALEKSNARLVSSNITYEKVIGRQNDIIGSLNAKLAALESENVILKDKIKSKNKAILGLSGVSAVLIALVLI